ncbi:MAG TPA: hypothetical protein VJK09_01610 [Candidatus Paceibacterota bacterium]
MSEQNKGLVEGLKEKLYKKGIFKADVSRSRFSLPRTEVETKWQGETEQVSKGILNPVFLKKFFIFALLFFVLTIGASAYLIWSGSNVVSAENLDIILKGPTSIKGGDELSLGIVVSNNNATTLEFVDLIVSFPMGTRESANLEKELSRFRKNLGTLERGEIVNESIKAVLFGEAGKEQEVKVAVEYRTAGSNAIFEKTKIYDVLISASPLDISLTIPEEIHAGNQTEFTADISVSGSSGLSNILVKAEYPSGFQFKSASPKPVFGNNVWDLGDLGRDSKRRISITGILDGQDNEKKLFKIIAGTAKADRESEIGVPYGSTFATVLMRRSFVDLATVLSGQIENEIISDPERTLRGDISWTNNLPDKLLNSTVNVHFTGNALDQASVSVGKGSYQSLSNIITWTRQHEPSLAIIEPAGSGSVNFDFSTLPSFKLSLLSVRNPYIQADISFDATRVVEGNPGEIVHTALTKMIRVNSHIELLTKALYSSGTFVNTGPMPPRANQETTYTIVWSLVNTSNDLDGVTVRGLLPSHSRFLTNVSPLGADIKYDNTTGIVTWNVGRVEAGISIIPVREASFQISLLPSIPQVNQTIPLVTNMSYQGRDLFTGSNLENNLALIDMRITSDPNFKEEWTKVSP